MLLLWRASSPVMFRAHRWRENCLYFNAWKLLKLNFLNCNYKSRSIEYNCNWSWHHTLHLKKKTFSIFENLLKTSGTTTKVLSCLKIPLTSMRVDPLASCENILPGFQASSIVLLLLPTPPDWSLKPPGRNSSTASAEEFYYSFHSE